ncbi:uncharacterized protein C05D11.1-like [Condylostylus longicornis]|uniref:uncharacterized protein C05D11.1-like n=1 Tax=Condylostylus longicornis TaxID=2530218 RepID=UPI00244E448C|nr:uncharacterized protein C05D11.1-like [Condylostylus longicornis]
MSSFKLVTNTKINGYIDAQKYKSEQTGLKVVICDVDGPVVNGYYTLATEAHDDDGLPHTLEHLIFLGSEKYPYKGVLDLLANRCLASGTNAWTDTDHTCYTMTTAGSDGFLTLMPIYLDHVLYPILSDSGFITEVHHISGEGEDGGVVYCEMQGRENTGESRANLQMLRLAYPSSGYSAETGGIMKNLRTSCNNDKIKKYHAKFYRPENLTLIIAGKVKPEKVFEALEPVEQKIIGKGKLPKFEKPWQTPVAPLTESHDIKILYPSDEEDCGLVYIGYRGPNCIHEYKKLMACNVLLRYLSDTPVSPLQREFVEIDDPFASKVSHSLLENYESLLVFIFDNVPIEKIDLVLSKLKETLKKFLVGEEKVDMSRMKSILDRLILENLSNLENEPHDTAAYLVIGDALYGTNDNDFCDRLNPNKFFEAFLEMDENYWITLIKEYLFSGSFICVRAFPSIEENNRMSKEELDRIEKQRVALGQVGLNEKGEKLQKAMDENEIPPPPEMLTHVPVPSIDGINFHELKIYKASNTESISCFNFSDIPVYSEVYDINTNFIYITITMNTSGLEPKYRSYLLLLLEMLLESPVRRNGTLIPYEEVVAALERDTIDSSTTLGLEGCGFSVGVFSHVATLSIQVDSKKYEKGVEWVIDLLHSTEFPADRIKVCASKMFNNVSQAKRKGHTIAKDLLKAMYYDEESNVKKSSVLKQQKFLGEIIEYLDKSQDVERIIADIAKVRSELLKPENLSIHIAANVKMHSKNKHNLSEPWKNILREGKGVNKKELIVIPDWKIIKSDGIYPDMQGTVVGMGCVESAFLFHSIPSIKNFNDPDLPALMLYLQYLTQLEGPLWRQIRGQGFAYCYTLIPRPQEGVLSLSLYRASNVVAAFKEAKSIIENHLSSAEVWDENLFESARSSLIFELIEREHSIGNLVTQGILCGYKMVDSNHNRHLVREVSKIKMEQLKTIGAKYVSPLFSKNAKTAIVCHPDRVQEIANGFASMDRKLTTATTLEESILSK